MRTQLTTVYDKLRRIPTEYDTPNKLRRYTAVYDKPAVDRMQPTPHAGSKHLVVEHKGNAIRARRFFAVFVFVFSRLDAATFSRRRIPCVIRPNFRDGGRPETALGGP
jgi:hypothetical protein